MANMYFSIKELEKLKQAVETKDFSKVEEVIIKFDKKYNTYKNSMKNYMYRKRKTNKNYGNHYIYKDGSKR